MGIAVRVLGPQAHARQHVASLGGALRLAKARVDGERVLQHGRYLLARIERPIGVLEHQLHGLPQLAPLVGLGAHRVMTDQRELPGRRLFDQRDHARERGLAAARFADHGERAPALDAKGNIADGAQLRRRAEQAATHVVGALQVARLHDDVARQRAHDNASTTLGRSASMAAMRPGSPSGKWQRTCAPGCDGAARSAGRTLQALVVT